MTTKSTVLVVDHEEETRALLGELLSDAGFDAVLTATLSEATAAIERRQPNLVLLEPGVDGGRGLELMHQLRAAEFGGGVSVPVIVVTRLEGEGELTHAFEAGTVDFVRKPIRGAELLARIRAHIRMREYVGELAEKERDAQVMLELTQALASSLDFREILYTVVRRIAEYVHVDRVSIVLAPEMEAAAGEALGADIEPGGPGPDRTSNVGYVVVASDDAQLWNLKIDLENYPEIQQVLRSGESLRIDDVRTHPILDGVRSSVPSDAVASMMLLPISWQEQVLGVLFLRGQNKPGTLGERDLGFCRIVANATAIAVRNARVMQTLRDHTQQETFARFEAERRLQSLKRYADLFASSADGIGVSDQEGRLLFANPRAYEILGHPADSFRGKKVKELLQSDEEGRAGDLWDGFADGRFPRDVDLKLVRADGKEIVINVSFSSLVHGEGAVLFSFRDVTEGRQLETELVKTKEFLESMIQASVDAIVAADLDGEIVLFNEGAERIYAYPAADVVGKMNVRALYPEGVAREVMAMIRSPQHGGEGRLESTRLDALDANGERVPISLSAALIYEGDEEVATFGIFTDLRDRLRVEERLAQAQQKLAVTEKQALIAELAGTAAHELNQPLTSVMGYAELLKRKLERETAEYHAADIIVREAERMADIVRKIGKITKYETKSYVGQQKILDLDKAAGNDEPSTQADH